MARRRVREHDVERGNVRVVPGDVERGNVRVVPGDVERGRALIVVRGDALRHHDRRAGAASGGAGRQLDDRDVAEPVRLPADQAHVRVLGGRAVPYTVGQCESSTQCALVSKESGAAQVKNGVLAGPETESADGPRAWPYVVDRDPVVGDVGSTWRSPPGRPTSSTATSSAALRVGRDRRTVVR